MKLKLLFIAVFLLVIIAVITQNNSHKNCVYSQNAPDVCCDTSQYFIVWSDASHTTLVKAYWAKNEFGICK